MKQNKDADAYGQLYDFYVDRIYRFILFKVSTTEEAEDLTSEVFLKTWEYVNKTNKKIQNINALFYRVARNAVIDFYRTRRFDSQISDQEQLKQIQDKRNLQEQTEARIEVEDMQKSLLKLKDEYREIIILKHIEDFSINEIAEILDKSVGNVRVLLHRAITALKEIKK